MIDPDYNDQPLIAGYDIDIRAAYPLMDAVGREEGWDDPEMDSYNILGEKPPA
jgi:hypothetical protein